MELDVLELAYEVEALYQDRCNSLVLEDCYHGNHDHRQLSFPVKTCPDSPDRYILDCGDRTKKRGITCSSLWNFTVSNVRVLKDYAKGKDQNPTDPDIIETICFTRDLNDWFRNKDEADNFSS
jgi:hypothetical protein